MVGADLFGLRGGSAVAADKPGYLIDADWLA